MNEARIARELVVVAKSLTAGKFDSDEEVELLERIEEAGKKSAILIEKASAILQTVVHDNMRGLQSVYDDGFTLTDPKRFDSNANITGEGRMQDAEKMQGEILKMVRRLNKMVRPLKGM
jgi:hypothetical protein